MVLNFDETDLFQLLLTNLSVVGTMSNKIIHIPQYVVHYLYMCMSVYTFHSDCLCACHPMHCNIKCSIA